MPTDASTHLPFTSAAAVDTEHVIALPPAFLERFEIGPLLGRGTMGVVYRALDRRMRRPVALKLLARGRGEEMTQRFLREGRLLARVSHPRVIAVYDVDELDGHPCMITELAEGGSLAARLAQEGTLHHGEAAQIMGQVLDGLEACHRAGIVHRDLKPANILLDASGEPKIADLGIALYQQEIMRLTVTGAAVGTPLYMAPEQLAGGEAGVATDIYTVGMVLHQLITGKLPYTANSLAELIARANLFEAPDLRTLFPDLPSSIALAVMKSLARDPKARYASAAAMAEALRGTERDEQPVAPPVSATFTGRSTRPLYVAVALGLIAGAAWQVSSLVHRDAPAPPASASALPSACAQGDAYYKRLNDAIHVHWVAVTECIDPAERAVIDPPQFDPPKAKRLLKRGIEQIDLAHATFSQLALDVGRHADEYHGQLEDAPDLEAVVLARALAFRFASWGRRQQAMATEDATERALSTGEQLGVLAFQGARTADPSGVELLVRADRALEGCVARTARGLEGQVFMHLLEDYLEVGYLVTRINWEPAARQRALKEIERLMAALRVYREGPMRDFALVAIGTVGRRYLRLAAPETQAAMRAGTEALDRLLQEKRAPEEDVARLKVRFSSRIVSR